MARLFLRRLAPLVFLPGALVVGCGGGGGGGTPPPTTTIAKASTNSGDAQSGTVGQPLANPLQVIVTEDGAPSSGATVAWSTTALGSTLDPASATTDANGNATAAWMLGTVSGSQTARATLTGATGSPVSFTATAAPGAASSISKAAGEGQTGEVGTQLGAALQAKVTDQFGNGVPGVDVGWTTTGGTLSGTTVPTDGSGTSAVTLTLPATVGPVTITATADVLTGSSALMFTATAAPVPPIPTSASVRVGNILFSSNRNSTVNPAVDTVAVGGTVTWTWVNTLTTPHSVLSTGAPSFTSSVLMTGNGQSYSFTFPTAGTYQYTCMEHPGQMTGRIVVR
jgi:plastocyanin